MAYIPNLRRRAERLTPFPYIDNLFDYGTFLAEADAHGSIGNMPADNSDLVIVVGAGLSGLVCAYELLRAGVRNVLVLEATDRIGGRLYSDTFGGGSQLDLAELGAMRFPPSEFGLFHYLDKFGIDANGTFPDPGTVDTVIGYQGEKIPWPAGGERPEKFKRVYDGWVAFVDNGYQVPGGPTLTAPADITKLLVAREFGAAQAAWQAYIDHFERASFYEGMVAMFTGPNPPGGEAWELPDDFDLFGAIGVGSGGFGPLYAIGFLEIVRLMVNELETEQKFVPNGISRLISALLAQSFGGSTLYDRVRPGTVVDQIGRDSTGKPLVQFGDARVVADRVVLATSNRAAQIDLGITATDLFLTPRQATAVNTVHMTSSAKVFVRTQTKFWQQIAGLPANIQTDTLVRGVYCLDYSPGNANEPGVVLLSYTWEDDAIKQLALGGPEERVKRLVADLAQTSPEFARYIVPINNDYVNNVRIVDWDTEPHYYGAFKLGFPGTDSLAQQAFFQFQSARTPETDRQVYLAGDSYSFTGGWTEGAIQTGVNAACAVIASLGGTLYSGAYGNPLNNQNPNNYNYDRVVPVRPLLQVGS